MHLNGLNTQHGKSHSVVASQGTSRASSPGPANEQVQTNTAATSSTESSAAPAAASRPVAMQDSSNVVAASSQQDLITNS